MFWFVTGLVILLVLAIPILVFVPRRLETTEGDIPAKMLFGIPFLFLALLLIGLSCLSKVDTRNVGVETVFGSRRVKHTEQAWSSRPPGSASPISMQLSRWRTMVPETPST
jgi:hypothetical protein